MTDHQLMISRRGGIRGLARKLGHSNHTTVQGWWERGNIPEHRMAEVEAVPEVPNEQAAA